MKSDKTTTRNPQFAATYQLSTSRVLARKSTPTSPERERQNLHEQLLITSCKTREAGLAPQTADQRALRFPNISGMLELATDLG